MGRKPKPHKSKDQIAREKLAEMFGMEKPNEEIAVQQARTEEAILAYVKQPELFKKRQCDNCGNMFAVNRSNVAYCGTYCRIKSLADIGITYRGRPSLYELSEQQWVYRVYGPQGEPLVVPPSALEAAQAVLRAREQRADDDQQLHMELHNKALKNKSIDDLISGVDEIIHSFDGSLNNTTIETNVNEESVSISNETVDTTSTHPLISDEINALIDASLRDMGYGGSPFNS